MNNQSIQSITFTQHWFNSSSMQNAPQETEIESYVIGGVKQDVKKDQFKIKKCKKLLGKVVRCTESYCLFSVGSILQ